MLRDSATLVDFGLFVANPEDDIVMSDDDDSKMAIMFTDQSSEPRIIGLDLTDLELVFRPSARPGEILTSGRISCRPNSATGAEFYFVIERDNFKSKRKDHAVRDPPPPRQRLQSVHRLDGR